MDGLLVVSERVTLQAWLAAAAERGTVLAETDYLQVVGRAAAEAQTLLTGMLGDAHVFAELMADVRMRPTDTGEQPLFPLKPGGARVLQALADAGVPCAVASSSRREKIEYRLGRVGVLHHFRAWAGGNDVPRGKPDPALYRLAAERLGGWIPWSAWPLRTAKTVRVPHRPQAWPWWWCLTSGTQRRTSQRVATAFWRRWKSRTRTCRSGFIYRRVHRPARLDRMPLRTAHSFLLLLIGLVRWRPTVGVLQPALHVLVRLLNFRMAGANGHINGLVALVRQTAFGGAQIFRTTARLRRGLRGVDAPFRAGGDGGRRHDVFFRAVVAMGRSVHGNLGQWPVGWGVFCR